MVKSEQNSEHKSTYIERDRVERDRVERDRYKSTSRTSKTTTDKMTLMLSLRTLKDVTEKPNRTNDDMIHLLQLLLDLLTIMNEFQNFFHP